MVAVLKWLAIALLVAAPAHADAPAKPDEDPEPKLSLPTESDRVAWLDSGFRLGLGVGYGRFEGLGGAPSGHLVGAVLHAGLRLDRDWSLMSTFEYSRVKQSGGLSGLRFSGTIDPTWHLTPSFSVAFGIGFGGIVEGTTGRPDVSPMAGMLNASYTFPDASTPLPSCSGVGITGVARAEYTYVLGPRSATGVALEAMGQYTACVERTGRLDADTAQAIVRRQYWPHAGFALQWSISWR